MTIRDEIEALDDLATNELVDRYVELHGKEPRRRHRGWLLKRVAWKIQERAFGGLSRIAKRRLEELAAEIDLPFAPEPPPRTDHRVLSTGTTLTREWRGQEIRVVVLEGGFEWNGERYRSLSAIARAATGTSWNGWAFFGLKRAEVGR